MATLLLGVGLVLTLEGLVLALLPGRLEGVVEFLRSLDLDTRRLMGLAALATGVALIWAARLAGA